MSEIFVIQGYAHDWKEALKMTGTHLYENGCVVEKFWEKCAEREAEFPTGLTEFCPVAIPHASKEYVLKQAICALKLEKPVSFKSMADWDQDIDVRYVLNLALLDDSEHIKIVTRVIRSLKDPAFLKKMDECDEEELKVLLNDYFLTEKLDD
ncbi:MAG: PTS sugar transporter subunit IIA [Erysipelotrichaceae bacterium]|nr:PTS sugar transporter subunit IIA [Erysipelotrichaceae bacterium]